MNRAEPKIAVVEPKAVAVELQTSVPELSSFVTELKSSVIVENPAVLPRLLLVDDDEAVRSSLTEVLARNGFEVIAAGNVPKALAFILNEKFDVLLSDLHMPDPGDGLTVVSAMRHSHPKAVTLIFSGFPRMKAAAAAILLQADEVLTKPMAIPELIATIHRRMKQGATISPVVENVAGILELETKTTIAEWLVRVHDECHILTIPMDDEARSAHLPHLFRDLISRLRNPLPLGTRALVSASAAEHGLLRQKQGYTASMLVEESRMLQVSIFHTLQNNLHKIDFSLLLVGVMSIADEVDSQLGQTMASFISETKLHAMPALA